MVKKSSALLAGILMLTALGCAVTGCGKSTGVEEPTPTSAVTKPSDTPLPTDIPVPTATPTDTPTPTATPTDTPTPSPDLSGLLSTEEMSREGMEEGIRTMAGLVIDVMDFECSLDERDIYEIWNWVNDNIKPDKDLYEGDELKSAYEGLFAKKGGIATKNAVFAELVNYSGFAKLSVSAANEEYKHSWNLVSVGEGWYHFDFYKPEKGNYVCFMQTDEQVKAMTADLYPNFTYYELPEGLPERALTPRYNGYMETWITEPELTLSEQQILAKIEELKVLYPSGKYWNRGGITDEPCDHAVTQSTCNRYESLVDIVYTHGGGGTQCRGFGNLISDAVFGTEAGVEAFTSFDDLKVGDLFRIMLHPELGVRMYHTAMIIEKHDDYVLVGEANYDYTSCKIRWGGKYTRKYLEDRGTWYIRRLYTLVEE